MFPNVDLRLFRFLRKFTYKLFIKSMVNILKEMLAFYSVSL